MQASPGLPDMNSGCTLGMVCGERRRGLDHRCIGGSGVTSGGRRFGPSTLLVMPSAQGSTPSNSSGTSSGTQRGIPSPERGGGSISVQEQRIPARTMVSTPTGFVHTPWLRTPTGSCRRPWTERPQYKTSSPSCRVWYPGHSRALWVSCQGSLLHMPAQVLRRL